MQTLLCWHNFLEDKYRRALADYDDADEVMLRTIYNGLVSINSFMRYIYGQPLWVEPADAGNLAELGLEFLRALNEAATQAFEAEATEIQDTAQGSPVCPHCA